MASVKLAITKYNGTSTNIRLATYRFIDASDNTLKYWYSQRGGMTLEIKAGAAPFVPATVDVKGIWIPTTNANDPNIFHPLIAIDGKIYVDEALVMDANGQTYTTGGYLGSVEMKLDATRYWYSNGQVDHTRTETGSGYALGVIPGAYAGGMRLHGLTDTFTQFQTVNHGVNMPTQPGIGEVGVETDMIHTSQLFRGPATITGTVNHLWKDYAKGIWTQWGPGNNIIGRGDGTYGPGVAVDFSFNGILSSSTAANMATFTFDPDGGL